LKIQYLTFKIFETNSTEVFYSMWLLFLIFMQAPPERVELKVLDMGLYPAPSTPPILMEQDMIK